MNMNIIDRTCSIVIGLCKEAKKFLDIKGPLNSFDDLVKYVIERRPSNVVPGLHSYGDRDDNDDATDVAFLENEKPDLQKFSDLLSF